MPRMGKTEGDWNGLKLGLLKTVRPNSFSTLIPAACNFKNNALDWDIFVCLRSLILSLTCNFFVYFKLHSDWGRVIGKIKQNELDSCDTAPLTNTFFATTINCQFLRCLVLLTIIAFIWNTAIQLTARVSCYGVTQFSVLTLQQFSQLSLFMLFIDSKVFKICSPV